MDKFKIFQHQTFILYEREYEKQKDIPGKRVSFLTKKQLDSLPSIADGSNFASALNDEEMEY